ncbi:MAG: hypothetical protein HY291_12005 [Planctomycetes bacterium]|nr:hypothetical protein [Planctomycetota bacterium]
MKTTRTLSWIIGGTFSGFMVFGIIGMVAQMDVIVRAPGELRPIKYADVRPAIEGIVLEVYKRDGDGVKAGEPILRMDARMEELEREKVRRETERLEGDLKDRERQRQECAAKLDLSKSAVKVAEADVESGKAKLQEVLSNLKQAEAIPDALEYRSAEERLRQQQIALKDAEKAYDDDQILFEKGLVSEQNLNKAQSVVETAKSELRVRENALLIFKKTRFGSDIEKAKAEAAGQKAALDAACARLDQRCSEVKLCELASQDESETRRLDMEIGKNRLAEKRLSREIAEKTLVAPLDGILYDFHAKPGQTVTHKERTAWVFDNSAFLFYGRVQQMDLSNIEKDNPALLYFDALPYRLEGTWDANVSVASQIAAPPTGNAGESILPLPGVTDNHPQALVILDVKPDPRNAKLRVGFTGYAEITVGRASLLEVLFGRTSSPNKK